MAAVDAKTRKAIYDDIDRTTIPQEMKLMYMMASACQSVVEDVHRRIKSVFRNHGLIAGENELLKGLNDYCKSVKAASFHFYNRIDPQIADATWGIGRDEDNPEGNPELYDGFSDDANEIVRLMMLYIDRTARDNKAFAKVFTTLRKLPSHELFEDKDIAHFKRK